MPYNFKNYRIYACTNIRVSVAFKQDLIRYNVDMTMSKVYL